MVHGERHRNCPDSFHTVLVARTYLWGTRPRYSYEKHQTYPAGELNFNSKLSDLSESEPSVGAKIEEDEMKGLLLPEQTGSLGCYL